VAASIELENRVSTHISHIQYISHTCTATQNENKETNENRLMPPKAVSSPTRAREIAFAHTRLAPHPAGGDGCGEVSTTQEASSPQSEFTPRLTE
jgi:hypothetical protein